MSALDKSSHIFEVKDYTHEDFSALSHMYDQFTPKARFQGMPPLNTEVRRKWLKHLIARGWNLLTWHDEAVVGHAVLFPELDIMDAEYLIFVHQSFRGCGLGKAITLHAIERARAFDLKCIWLTVDAYNFKAVRLYKKVGFRNDESYDESSERMMVMDV